MRGSKKSSYKRYISIAAAIRESRAEWLKFAAAKELGAKEIERSPTYIL
jgi:hypothetical protein